MPTTPPSDDVDRNAFYSSNSAETGDGDDYELEPPDEAILSEQRRRAEETLASVERTVDVDQLMREQEHRLDFELIDQWMSELRFQFQIKHLLWATAAVALLVAAAHYDLRASALLAVLMTVGGMLTFLTQKERQHQAALDERRRQQFSRSSASPTAIAPAAAEPAHTSLAEKLANICSLQELLMAAGIAVAILATLGIAFGTAVMATCLGLMALAGFLAQIIGIDLPRFVAMVWWVLLVLYVLVSAILAISGRF